MSKKKVTMTLKDFHGGYIHSDLPLPSAPGQPLRHGDRGGIDRQTSYGNSMGRSDNRLRPASAGSSRNLDDENPFFNYNLRIGRNFDEDERKPLHGVSGPRRTAVEESIPTQHNCVVEPKADNDTPFLGHSLHVGRNFDEEERKPLNGNSGPRRTVSDESIHVQPSRVTESKNYNMVIGRVGNSGPGHTPNFHRNFNEDEIKPLHGVSGPHRTVGDETIGTRPSRLVEPVIDNLSSVRAGSKNSQLHVTQSSSSSTRASYAGRVSEMRNASPNSKNFGGGRGCLLSPPNMGGGDEPFTNAWGLGKEMRSVQESRSASLSMPDPAMKLAQASALEKVSTGRWTSKQHIPSLKNPEVIGEVKIEVRPDYKAANNVENEKVGHLMQTDIQVPVDMWSTERSPVTVNENQPVDALSRPPQSVGADRFIAQPSLVVEPKADDKSGATATIVSQYPSVSLPQAGSSYFGGPNSYWSKEPVSIAWSSQDVLVNLPHSGSFEKVSYDHWNSKEQTTTEFDYRTNKINSNYTSTTILANGPDMVCDSAYHDLSDMMHTKASLSATDKMNDSQKDIRAYEMPQSNIQALPGHITELKQAYVLGSRVGNRSQPTSVSQISSDLTGCSYAERPVEAHNFGLTQQFTGDVNCRSGHSNAVGNISKAVVGPCSNPWEETKAMGIMKEPVSVAWSSSPDVKGKLINLGGFDKITSGKWNSKHPSRYDGVTGLVEPDVDFGYKEEKEISATKYTLNRLDLLEESEFHDLNPTMNVERSLSVDYSNDGGGEKEMPSHERVSSFEKNTAMIQSTGISSGVDACLTLPSESLVRPKLKLLPRSKPLDNSEPQVGLKQGFGQPKGNNIHPSISEIAGKEVAELAAQQPKLNLNPQLQALEQHKRSGDINRKTLFGGARPREVVLKERETEGYIGNSKSQLPSRANETARKDDSSKLGTSTRYSEKAENTLSGQRTTSSKYTNNRHDNKPDSSRTDVQRRNIQQNETRKNHKEVDQKQRQKRPSSPETWRKPIEQPSSTEEHQPSLRFGKAASAVELAQTFSRSVCDPLISGSRSVPSGVQIPFSRLVGPTRMLQTNGY